MALDLDRISRCVNWIVAHPIEAAQLCAEEGIQLTSLMTLLAKVESRV